MDGKAYFVILLLGKTNQVLVSSGAATHERVIIQSSRNKVESRKVARVYKNYT